MAPGNIFWSPLALFHYSIVVPYSIQNPGEKQAADGGPGGGLLQSPSECTPSPLNPTEGRLRGAGGSPGLFSAIIGGWLATGTMGSNVVTREIRE
jgi:hypothetical protein